MKLGLLNNTDCDMVILTAVYVVATIVIMVINLTTIHDTRKQIKKVIRDFKNKKDCLLCHT